ncbi:eukaryotic translation initiation factor 3 subunit M [Rhizodiscina lignyota]|uniref:Eukaryotic translation initiation factor 3 subunit M n=1 Tax=Rhizodiscina lignyota TaxID=1504668 RepID=A0A9P4MAY7_9PEZI|nr:eukaryotic translation initiation factor 3 subunit M [Rhizodiscina lignyota]
MPAPANTLLIEGSFDELADELAVYIDNLKKAQGDEGSAVQSDVSKFLQEGKKDEALKSLVGASSVLNAAPEKELIAAYNLLIHISRQSENVDMFLNRICRNLSKPITSSPANGSGLALSVLSTVFNIVPPSDDSRYHVLFAILEVIRSSANFESLKPQLQQLDSWLVQWDMDEEEQRKLYLAISEVAEEAGDSDSAYDYLIRGLRTIPTNEASGNEARPLALRALKAALVHPSHFDFQDLTALDAVQALRKSDETYFELLELFTSDVLEDYNDFKDEHDGWIEQEGLDGAVLNRKMRLLTLASLAAHAHQTRTLPYAQIAKALQIPSEDVEMWVIDVIRAGLIEGKLSQLNQTFLIHRCTYRVFGEAQWREVAGRLDMWRSSLEAVLGVIRREKQQFIVESASGKPEKPKDVGIVD